MGPFFKVRGKKKKKQEREREERNNNVTIAEKAILIMFTLKYLLTSLEEDINSRSAAESEPSISGLKAISGKFNKRPHVRTHADSDDRVH